ncbi:MAG: hypothetical protein AAFO59_05800 [Cyanobacteria bacterium J06607_17]
MDVSVMYRGFVKRLLRRTDAPAYAFKRHLTRSQWYKEIDPTFDDSQAILSALRENGIAVKTQSVDLKAFSNWVDDFGWSVPEADANDLPADIAAIATVLRQEKLLEYYVSTTLVETGDSRSIADIGSAESDFLKLMTSEYGSQCWAVDPCLSNDQSSNPRIQHIPHVISVAEAKLPRLDAITLHCSFEMFAPNEMAAVIQVASEKLVKGGKCIISPLYLAPARRIYVDASVHPQPQNLSFDPTPSEVVAVKDYWKLSWSEWLSPQSLYNRLVRSFTDLEFQVIYLNNIQDVYSGCFLHFIGVWTKK